jgi:hypothetical protein
MDGQYLFVKNGCTKSCVKTVEAGKRLSAIGAASGRVIGSYTSDEWTCRVGANGKNA